MAGVEIMCTL